MFAMIFVPTTCLCQTEKLFESVEHFKKGSFSAICQKSFLGKYDVYYSDIFIWVDEVKYKVLDIRTGRYLKDGKIINKSNGHEAMNDGNTRISANRDSFGRLDGSGLVAYKTQPTADKVLHTVYGSYMFALIGQLGENGLTCLSDIFETKATKHREEPYKNIICTFYEHRG